MQTNIIGLTIDHEGDVRPISRLPENRYGTASHYFKPDHAEQTELSGILYVSSGTILHVPDGGMAQVLDQQDPQHVFIKGPVLTVKDDDCSGCGSPFIQASRASGLLGLVDSLFGGGHATCLDDPMTFLMRKAKLGGRIKPILDKDPDDLTQRDAEMLAMASVSEPRLFDEGYDPQGDDLIVRLERCIIENRDKLLPAIREMRRTPDEPIRYNQFAQDCGDYSLAADLKTYYDSKSETVEVDDDDVEIVEDPAEVFHSDNDGTAIQYRDYNGTYYVQTVQFSKGIGLADLNRAIEDADLPGVFIHESDSSNAHAEIRVYAPDVRSAAEKAITVRGYLEPVTDSATDGCAEPGDTLPEDHLDDAPPPVGDAAAAAMEVEEEDEKETVASEG